MMNKHILVLPFIFLLSLMFITDADAQMDQNMVFDTSLYAGMKFRNVGPFRGGRSTAVTGYPDRPFQFLMGTTGGGVWQSDDAGTNWNNITDGFFGGSIGAVAVADADPNVIYVGAGSADPRGNTSAGRGVYKSMDGGKTWAFSGLREAGQIGKIRVHPKDPDLVYVAALGHIFGPNKERGIFRSKDGGQNWEHVLFLSDETGAVSLAMNPNNPRQIYAGMWRAERKPWSMLSGSEESGVYMTMDSGDTWKKLEGGLPEGMVGKVGVTVSPANPDRVWAIIEAEPTGGIYRSDDAGKTWKRTNKENKLRQRAWYYTHVVADPQNPNTVYALNTRLYRSIDAGKTFEVIQVPHGDVHDLWINPHNTDIMVVANDGGAQVTLNHGKSWSTYYNQPTAELYGVVVDNGFPYRLYGAQQDNTTISVPSWISANSLHPKQEWYSVGGCETGPIALHPDYPSMIYAGCYGGVMDRYDLETEDVQNVMSYPQLQLGEAAKNLKYRFQWVSPMAVSLQDRNEIFHGSQHVMRSKDRGETWEEMSPDLTTNTPEHQDYSGGPINHDITGVEIYNTVFAITPSPHTQGTVWAGTDDGRVHITRDDGDTWQEITPSDCPQYGTVNHIEVSTHQAGRAFLAVQKYRFDDFKPYIFMTNNYGKTWKTLTNGSNGIPDDYPVRVVREDPDKKGLLYAGTEFGLFVSFNEGQNWQPLQMNMPITPITDLRVHQKDLVMSTQGRSFWILDDVSPLHELNSEIASANAHLFEPRTAYRMNALASRGEYSPEQRPKGALIYYNLKDKEEVVNIEISTADGDFVRGYSSDSIKAKEFQTPLLKNKSGMHRINWDLKFEGPTFADGAVIWGYKGGVKAPPGIYDVTLTYGNEAITQKLEVKADPRLKTIDPSEYEEQLNTGLEIREAINNMHRKIKELRDIKEQIDWVSKRSGDIEIEELGAKLNKELGDFENQLMQTKNESNQDPIRFAPRLDNQMVELYSYVTGEDGYISGGAEGKPKKAALDRKKVIDKEWSDIKIKVEKVITESISAFNTLTAKKKVQSINQKVKP